MDLHDAVDFPAPAGSPVVSVMDGIVITVRYPYPNQLRGATGLANYIVIDHGNGLQTAYGHLMTIYVTEGQYLRQGDVIAGVGSTGYSTGPHLHFEVRTPLDSGPFKTYKMDPMELLQEQVSIGSE